MEKFALCTITLLLCLISTSWLLHISVITFMAFLVIGLGKIPWKVYMKFMALPLGFLMIGLLGVAFTVTKESSIVRVGFYVGDFMIGISDQGIKEAKVLFFRSYASVACLYFLALTTPMVDIIWVLKKFKTPLIFTELMTIIYRFIFVLMETAMMIFISQECRLGYISFKKSYVSLGQLVSNLFLKAFYRSQELFVALTSRGYTGDLAVLEEEYQPSTKNIMLIAGVEIILMTIAFMG